MATEEVPSEEPILFYALDEETWTELRKANLVDWKVIVPSGLVVAWLRARPRVRAKARSLPIALWMLSQK